MTRGDEVVVSAIQITAVNGLALDRVRKLQRMGAAKARAALDGASRR